MRLPYFPESATALTVSDLGVISQPDRLTDLQLTDRWLRRLRLIWFGASEALSNAGVRLGRWFVQIAVRSLRPSPGWLPAAVLLLGLVLSTTAFLLLLHLQRQQAKAVMQLAAASLRADAISDLAASLRPLAALAQNWQHNSNLTDAARQAEAMAYLKEFPALEQVGWLDARTEQQWSLSLPGGPQSALASEWLALAATQSLVTAAATPEPVLRHVPTESGKQRLIAIVPVGSPDHVAGFLLGVYRTDLLQQIVADHLGYGVAVLREGEEVFRSGARTEEAESLMAEAPFDFHGARWRIQVWPEAALSASLNSYLPQLALFAGIALSAVLAAAIQCQQKLRLETRDRVRKLSGMLLQAEDAERRRIARELHDSAAQTLFSLTLNLNQLTQQRGSQGSADPRLLSDCLSLVEQCERDIRTACLLLHPPALPEGDLLSNTRAYANAIAARTGLSIELDMPETLPPLPQETELTAYRLVQEGLTNIVRHSRSPRARLHLEQKQHRLCLEIEDVGSGMSSVTHEHPLDVPPAPGLGLETMRERVHHVGGTLTIDSSAAGTTIRAILPLTTTLLHSLQST